MPSHNVYMFFQHPVYDLAHFINPTPSYASRCTGQVSNVASFLIDYLRRYRDGSGDRPKEKSSRGLRWDLMSNTGASLKRRGKETECDQKKLVKMYRKTWLVVQSGGWIGSRESIKVVVWLLP